MTLIDVNVLLSAANRRSEMHAACVHWLSVALNSTQSVGMPWHSLLGFLRISTNPKFTSSSLTMAQAWDVVESWLDHPAVWSPEPGPNHRHIFGDLIRHTPGTHKWVADTHLAALAIEHGLTLVSTDGDFTRFRGLNFLNPLSVHRG